MGSSPKAAVEKKTAAAFYFNPMGPGNFIKLVGAVVCFLGWPGSAVAAEMPPDFLWARKAGAADSEESRGLAVALDALGNCYVTGLFFGVNSLGSTNLVSSGLDDVFVAKYDTNGNLLWARKAGGPGSDEGWAIAVDPAGNAFVTGLFQETANFGNTNLSAQGESDLFVAKYDSTGGLVWARRAGGNDFDEGHGVALDAAGNAYLTGYFNGTATFGSQSLTSFSVSNAVFVAKCDGNGNFLWARKAGGNFDAEGNAIAVEGTTNVYVVGAFAGTATFATTNIVGAGPNGLSDAFLAKYDSAGNFLWVRKAGGNGIDEAFSVASDPSGNVALTGKISGAAAFGSINLTGNGADIFVAKYDRDGNVLWARKAGGNSAIYGDSGFAVRIDMDGNAVVAGYFSSTANFGSTNLSTAGFDDIFVAKYDAAGALLWARKAGGANLDIGYGLGLDSSGNAYVTGFFSGTAAFDGMSLTSGAGDGARNIFITKLGRLVLPGLRITKSAEGVTLSWPASASDYYLEMSSNLLVSNWTIVAAPTNIVGESRVVLLPASGEQKFFRLRK